MDVDVDVDILESRLTSLRLPPWLSEPHDQPYLMQLYVTKLLQIHSFTNPDTTPYKCPMVGAWDGVMGRGMPYQGPRITVQPYNSTTVRRMAYDVRQVRRTMYNSMTRLHMLSKHVVSK